MARRARRKMPGVASDRARNNATGKRSIRNVVYPTVWAVRLQIEIGASGVNLYWPSKLGRSYQLYRSTVLLVWEAIGARIPGDGLAQNYFDKRDGTMPRFYRITEFTDT